MNTQPLPTAQSSINGKAGHRTTGKPTGTSMGKGKGLNPESKPYLPKYQRSAPDLHRVAAGSTGGYAPRHMDMGVGMGVFGGAASPSQYGNGLGTGQMYPDGTFVYPSIAPHPYPSNQHSQHHQYAAGPLHDTVHPIASYSTNDHPYPRNTSGTTARPELSSLQHLLEAAGYADTRVHTPPAERIRQLRQARSFVKPRPGADRAYGYGYGNNGGYNTYGRRIKKTFDEVDVEEVRDLYTTFGLGYGATSEGSDQFVDDGQQDESPTKVGSTDHHHHLATHITAPAIPIKSSSSMLRDVALQDIAHQALSPPSASSPAGSYNRSSGSFGEMDANTQHQNWWNGFNVLNRAVAAVREMSPTKESAGFDFGFAPSSVTSGTSGTGVGNSTMGSITGANTSGSVGLGLARGGEGVKKAKSAFTLGRQSAARTHDQYEYERGWGRYGGDEMDQEQVQPARAGRDGGDDMLSQGPPALSFPSLTPSTATTSTIAHASATTATSRRGAMTDLVIPRPSSLTHFEDADSNDNGLYSPLPADYETQCEDDELFSTSFDVGSEQSFGSSDSPDQAFFVLPPVHANGRGDGLSGLGFGELHNGEEDAGVQEGEVEVGGSLGMRIMRDAVELDDCDDSPIRAVVPLPPLGNATETTEAEADADQDAARKKESGDTPQRPPVARAQTTPSPSRIFGRAVGCEADEIAQTGSGLVDAAASSTDASSEEAKAGDIMEQAKKPLKYGDRATKLRMARSTPALVRSLSAGAALTPQMPVGTGKAGWLASIRNYLPLGYDTAYTSNPKDVTANSPVSNSSAIINTPFRLTPALPAAPTMARAAAVVCDSSSDMAEDLPAIPASMTATAHAAPAVESAAMAMARKASMGRMGPSSSAIASGPSIAQAQTLAVRLRPSLAKMRSMVWGPSAGTEQVPPVPPMPRLGVVGTGTALSTGNAKGQDGESDERSNTPMLSPRMDLSEGEAFAGWSPVKVQRGPRIGERGEVYTPKKAVWAHHASNVAASGSREEAVAKAKAEEEEEVDGYGSTVIDYTKSFFYKPCTPPAHVFRSSGHSRKAEAGEAGEQGIDGSAGATDSSDSTTSAPAASASTDAKIARRQRSIKSLRKALLIPVAPSAPPVPALPANIPSAPSTKQGQTHALKRHSRSIASFTAAAARVAGIATQAGTASASASGSGSSSLTSSGQTIPQLRTPPAQPQDIVGDMPEPPAFAILSPGAWEAGLPPRALVIEDEEWAAGAQEEAGDAGRGRKGKKGKKVRRKGSSKSIRAE